MEILQDCMVSIALLGVAVLCGWLVRLAKKGMDVAQESAASIKNDVQRKLVTDALEDIERLAVNTVGALEQTTAKTLREAVKAGTADRSQLESLALVAAQEIKDQLLPEYRGAIEDNFGDLNKYLKDEIESTLLMIKSGA